MIIVIILIFFWADFKGIVGWPVAKLLKIVRNPTMGSSTDEQVGALYLFGQYATAGISTQTPLQLSILHSTSKRRLFVR